MGINADAEVERDGFALISGFLDAEECGRLIGVMGVMNGAGRRGLLGVPEIAKFALSERLIGLLRPHLPKDPRPVRAILFDKAPGTGWVVAWHQDVTLAVTERLETPRFGPWSVKQGVVHVQPPAELLEQMLTIRIHLDDTDETNGALRVIPGTHMDGRVTPEKVATRRAEHREVLCVAKAGDAWLMRPLLLHASGRSTAVARHRRVLHIEYAGFELPGGLRWFDGG